MQVFSHLALTPCAPFVLSRTIWGTFELRYRLSEFHEHAHMAHMTLLLFSLVGWPKLVKFRSGGCMERSETVSLRSR